MTLRRRQFLQLTAGAAALPLVPRLAVAQGYPARSMHLVASVSRPARRPTS